MNIYILIIFMHVYGGNIAHSIEFSSKLNCEQTKLMLENKDNWKPTYSYLYCVPK